MAYDKRFRTRVVAYIREGHTQKEAADVFKVGTTSIKRWLAAHDAFGTAGGGYTVANRAAKKIDPRRLEAYMGARPDAFLREVALEFSCCIESARKALQRNGYRLKKNVFLQGARRAGALRVCRADGGDPRGASRLRRRDGD